MNRKLLVTLLHKNIEELGMITESFMEMNEYPQAIIQLAKRKTEDIQTIIDELAVSKQLEQSNIEKDVSIIFEKEASIILEDNKAEIIEEKQEYEEPKQIEPIAEELPVIEISLDEIETITETTVEQTVEIEEDDAKVETTLTTETVVTEVKTHTEEVKKVTIADKMGNHSTSRNEMLSHADNSLSASLANKKVTDIKQAISIGDRFRFQRELFKSNGEDMNKTLTYLNQLATLDEAMSFLKSKYGWEDNNEAVEDFYQIVKRKFV